MPATNDDPTVPQAPIPPELQGLNGELSNLALDFGKRQHEFAQVPSQAGELDGVYQQLMPKETGNPFAQPKDTTSLASKMKDITDKMDYCQKEMASCQKLIEQSRLANAGTNPSLSDIQKEVGKKVDALKELNSELQGNINVARRAADPWEGMQSVEQRLSLQVKGETQIMEGWKNDLAKVNQREQDLTARRDKLSSNPISKLWNRNEISKINKELNDSIPKQQAGLKEGIDSSQKNIQNAQAGLGKLAEAQAQQQAFMQAQQQMLQQQMMMQQQMLQIQQQALQRTLEQVKQLTPPQVLQGLRDQAHQEVMQQGPQRTLSPAEMRQAQQQSEQLFQQKLLQQVPPETLLQLQNQSLQQMLQEGQQQQMQQAWNKYMAQNPGAMGLQNSTPTNIQRMADGHMNVGEAAHLSHGGHGMKDGTQQPQQSVDKPKLGPQQHENVGEKLHLGLHGHGDKSSKSHEVGAPQHQLGQGVHQKR
ncbi:hypothetical protein DES53_12163 [Roseimicrobium gellanilyticum]|uniref:Uncharacterized protein n=1 Tax=Roseimicrobium gellanilyticum TaxID=748857 RepID=A0A366H2P0_9BACT|nr:hypothetical protein [Roseimicrobium gellanilyticum]RBP35543.1 hypothetical protein DES53_12163 [Roseimicrobium gellanilyticum]